MISLILLGLQSTSEIKQQLYVKRSVLDRGKRVKKRNVHTDITWWEGKVVNQDIPCRKWHHLHLSWCVSKSLKSEKNCCRNELSLKLEKIKIIMRLIISIKFFIEQLCPLLNIDLETYNLKRSINSQVW